MRYLILATLALFLTGCASDDEQPASPPQANSQVGENELFIALNVEVETNINVLPRMVYVFPPLRVNQQGVATEQLSYYEKPNGAIEWSPPTQTAALLQTAIQKELMDYGYQIVDFERLSDMRHAHEVLVVNAYYSPAYGDGSGPFTLVTRLSGSTFPVDLTPDRQTIRFEMNTQSFFLDNAHVLEAIEKNFYFSIENIGEQAGIDSTKLPLGKD